MTQRRAEITEQSSIFFFITILILAELVIKRKGADVES